MKKLWTVVVLGLSALSYTGALAHEAPKARHGGAVARASDLDFELVATPTGAVIYVADHGKPMAPTGMSGKLTVLKGSEKSES